MSDLKFGQTHWDDMSREELLMEAKRMYAVIEAETAILRMQQALNEQSTYWITGIGGRALEMARQILEPIEIKYGKQEPMYACYFRYAIDLLFDNDRYQIGYDWQICDTCGMMLGDKDLEGEFCSKVCTGHFRKLTWEDLEPIKE